MGVQKVLQGTDSSQTRWRNVKSCSLCSFETVGQLLHYSSTQTTEWLLLLQGQGAHSCCKQHLHLQTIIVRMFPDVKDSGT